MAGSIANRSSVQLEVGTIARVARDSLPPLQIGSDQVPMNSSSAPLHPDLA